MMDKLSPIGRKWVQWIVNMIKHNNPEVADMIRKWGVETFGHHKALDVLKHSIVPCMRRTAIVHVQLSPFYEDATKDQHNGWSFGLHCITLPTDVQTEFGRLDDFPNYPYDGIYAHTKKFDVSDVSNFESFKPLRCIEKVEEFMHLNEVSDLIMWLKVDFGVKKVDWENVFPTYEKLVAGFIRRHAMKTRILIMEQYAFYLDIPYMKQIETIFGNMFEHEKISLPHLKIFRLAGKEAIRNRQREIGPERIEELRKFGELFAKKYLPRSVESSLLFYKGSLEPEILAPYKPITYNQDDANPNVYKEQLLEKRQALYNLIKSIDPDPPSFLGSRVCRRCDKICVV